MNQPTIVVVSAVWNLCCLLSAAVSIAVGFNTYLVLFGTSIAILAATYAAWSFSLQCANERAKAIFDHIINMRAGKPLLNQLQGRDTLAEIDKAVYGINSLIADHRKSLESSDQKTRTLVAAVLVGILITDENGVILTINPRTQSLLQRRPEELVGKTLFDIFPATRLATPFTTERSKEKFETTYRLSDKTIYLEVTLNEFGKTSDRTWLVSLIDITDRTELERLKREFIQMITHDLRSPLSSILIYLEMITGGEYGTLTEEGAERSHSAKNSCKRLVELVNNLLDIDQFATGTIELNLDLSEVAAMFEKSVQSLSGIIEKKGLVLDIQGTDLELICDEDRLTQVLINLLSNAIKYSPDGGKLTIAASTAGNGIHFSVADEGPGIPEEYRQQVFDRFFQVEKQKKGSSGLGLAICREIVKAHQGEIGVDSNNGIGSKFWFTIPTLPLK